MDGTLILKKIIIRLKIGVLPFEKITSRNILIDLEWSGNVSSTPHVDYSEVITLISEFEGSEYSYIEELADDIMGRLLIEFPGSWSVTVTKPFPLVTPIMESASYTAKGMTNA